MVAAFESAEAICRNPMHTCRCTMLDQTSQAKSQQTLRLNVIEGGKRSSRVNAGISCGRRLGPSVSINSPSISAIDSSSSGQSTHNQIRNETRNQRKAIGDPRSTLLSCRLDL